MKNLFFSALCVFAIVFSASAGNFYKVQVSSNGVQSVLTPEGELRRIFSVDHVTRLWPRPKELIEKFKEISIWQDVAIKRLKKWGFNTLGYGADDDLSHKGLSHTICLNIVGFITEEKTKDIRYICSGFPNVFHEDFAAFCDRRARLVTQKDDKDLLGYYLDNELPWSGGRRIDTGMFDAALACPEGSSPRRAVESFLQSRGVKSAVDATKEDKFQFLSYTAEKYFSTISAAIKRYDPNHLILGCRFAGLKGAHDEVWRIAGKYMDIVSFNCYPYVNFERGAVYADIANTQLIAGEIEKKAKIAGKPLMVTEFSFPSVDSKLPCMYGCGMRVRTQKERAEATRLFIETLLSIKSIIGYSYFMWRDEPPEGLMDTFPEDTNYGLHNLDEEPYEELVNVIEALQTSKRIFKTPMPGAGKPRFSAPLEEFLKDAGLLLSASSSPEKANIKISRESQNLIDGVQFENEEYGAINLRFALRSTIDYWAKKGRIKSVKQYEKFTEVVYLFGKAGGENHGEAVFHVFSWPTKNAFLIKLVAVKNKSTIPWVFTQVNFLQKSPFSCVNVREATPGLYKRSQRAAWYSEDGRWMGVATSSKSFADVTYKASMTSFVKSGVQNVGNMTLLPDIELKDFIAPGDERKYDDAWALYLYGNDGRFGFKERTSKLPIFPEGNPEKLRNARRKVVREINGKKILKGSKDIGYSSFEQVTSPEILSRLDSSCADKILALDLKKIGISTGNVINYEFDSFKYFHEGDHWKDLPPLLFVDGKEMNLSSWPNNDWVMIDKILSPGQKLSKKERAKKGAGYEVPLPAFTYSQDRPKRWLKNEQIMLHGFFTFDWMDSYVAVKSIDTLNRKIELGHLLSMAMSKGNPGSGRWRAVNLVEEIDMPGEYAVDFKTGVLYFLPPKNFGPSSKISISDRLEPLVVLKGLRDIEFEGIAVEESAGIGIKLENCENVVFKNCVFRNLRRDGLVVSSNCTNCAVVDSVIEEMGTGGVTLEGATSMILAHSGNKVDKCQFNKWGKFIIATPSAIKIEGDGNLVLNSKFSNSGGRAFWCVGSQNDISYNVMSNLCSQVDDAGAYYQGRNPFQRGNELRHNTWVDIGSDRGHGTTAIYFDDGDVGNLVYSNVFIRCGYPGRGNFGSVFSHGGFDNYVRNCVFKDCIRPYGSLPWSRDLWEGRIFKYKRIHEFAQKYNVYKRPYTLIFPTTPRIAESDKVEERKNYAINSYADGTPLFRQTSVPGEVRKGVIEGNWSTNNFTLVNPVMWNDAIREKRKQIKERIKSLASD